MAYYGLLDFAMSFHHWSVIIGLVATLVSGVSGNYIMQAMIVTEISNPFMHTRIILRNHGMRYTYAYEICEFVFLTLYSIFRMIGGTYITFYMW